MPAAHIQCTFQFYLNGGKTNRRHQSLIFEKLFFLFCLNMHFFGAETSIWKDNSMELTVQAKYVLKISIKKKTTYFIKTPFSKLAGNITSPILHSFTYIFFRIS